MKAMRIVPRAACINDLSGYGRCSLSTVIPVLSVMGVQPCAVPTALLSKHTGFDDYRFVDFTPHLNDFLVNLRDIEFETVYTGFLGSEEQIRTVASFIDEHKKASVLVDPVMGDNGQLYSTYNDKMAEGMKHLAACADVITPNVTEACILTGMAYKGEEISDSQTRELALRLHALGAGSIVITGIKRGNSMLNFTYDGGEISVDEIHRVAGTFSGTGDIFAAVICACLARKIELGKAVGLAGDFISEAVRMTCAVNTPSGEGVLFEPFLSELGRRANEITERGK